MATNPYTPPNGPAYTIYSKVDVYNLFENLVTALGNGTYYGNGLPTVNPNLTLVDTDTYKWFVDLQTGNVYNYINGGWGSPVGQIGNGGTGPVITTTLIPSTSTTTVGPVTTTNPLATTTTTLPSTTTTTLAPTTTIAPNVTLSSPNTAPVVAQNTPSFVLEVDIARNSSAIINSIQWSTFSTSNVGFSNQVDSLPTKGTVQANFTNLTVGATYVIQATVTYNTNKTAVQSYIVNCVAATTTTSTTTPVVTTTLVPTTPVGTTILTSGTQLLGTITGGDSKTLNTIALQAGPDASGRYGNYIAGPTPTNIQRFYPTGTNYIYLKSTNGQQQNVQFTIIDNQGERDLALSLPADGTWIPFYSFNTNINLGDIIVTIAPAATTAKPTTTLPPIPTSTTPNLITTTRQNTTSTTHATYAQGRVFNVNLLVQGGTAPASVAGGWNNFQVPTFGQAVSQALNDATGSPSSTAVAIGAINGGVDNSASYGNGQTLSVPQDVLRSAIYGVVSLGVPTKLWAIGLNDTSYYDIQIMCSAKTAANNTTFTCNGQSINVPSTNNYNTLVNFSYVKSNGGQIKIEAVGDMTIASSYQYINSITIIERPTTVTTTPVPPATTTTTIAPTTTSTTTPGPTTTPTGVNPRQLFNVVGSDTTNSAMAGQNMGVYIPPNVPPNAGLTIFLHGSGQRGSNTNNTPANNFNILNGDGLPLLLSQGRDYKTYVAYPQSPPSLPSWATTPDIIAACVRYMVANYSINPNHIYLTGLSEGAYGTFVGAQHYSINGVISPIFAAFIECSGASQGDNTDYTITCTTPYRQIHGRNDGTVSFAQDAAVFFNINQKTPTMPGAIFEAYAQTPHSAALWNNHCYDSTLAGFNWDDWMLLHSMIPEETATNYVNLSSITGKLQDMLFAQYIVNQLASSSTKTTLTTNINSQLATYYTGKRVWLLDTGVGTPATNTNGLTTLPTGTAHNYTNLVTLNGNSTTLGASVTLTAGTVASKTGLAKNNYQGLPTAMWTDGYRLTAGGTISIALSNLNDAKHYEIRFYGWNDQYPLGTGGTSSATNNQNGLKMTIGSTSVTQADCTLNTNKYSALTGQASSGGNLTLSITSTTGADSDQQDCSIVGFMIIET
jgi:hypothetical protein